jgi:hypothetical protein
LLYFCCSSTSFTYFILARDNFDKSNFARFDGALRLSTKYQFYNIRAELISFLVTCFPSSLQKFKERNQALDGLEVAVINLARFANVPQVLPAAMYQLIMTADDEVFTTGTANPDGSTSFLERNDERACLIARSIILLSMNKRVIQEIASLREYCSGRKHGNCTHDSYLLQESIVAVSGRFLGPFHGKFWQNMESPDICSCLRKPSWKDRQERMWPLLPEWFGLGNWEKVLQK